MKNVTSFVIGFIITIIFAPTLGMPILGLILYPAFLVGLGFLINSFFFTPSNPAKEKVYIGTAVLIIASILLFLVSYIISGLPIGYLLAKQRNIDVGRFFSLNSMIFTILGSLLVPTLLVIGIKLRNQIETKKLVLYWLAYFSLFLGIVLLALIYGILGAPFSA